MSLILRIMLVITVLACITQGIIVWNGTLEEAMNNYCAEYVRCWGNPQNCNSNMLQRMNTTLCDYENCQKRLERGE